MADTASKSFSITQPSPALSILVAGIVVALTAYVRLELLPQHILPIAYGVPLLLCLWFNDRRILWAMAMVFAAVTGIKYFLLVDKDQFVNAHRWLSWSLVMADMLAIAVIVQILILARRTLEQRARDLENNVAALIRLQGELDTRRRQAEDTAISKTRFLAAVSHDIRTPANAINLLAELLARSANKPDMAADVPDMARELQASAAFMVNLVSDILDVTRFDYGRIELRNSEFDLNELAREHAQQLRALADARKLAMEIAPGASPIMVCADRVKLSRVVSNLIGNAIKFTETGQVRIAVQRTGDGGACLSVADSGIGIAPENVPYLFDEFYQIKHQSRERIKGTGLGLAISKRLIEAMGGRIDVQSSPGHGSTFTVILPPSVMAAAPTAVPAKVG